MTLDDYRALLDAREQIRATYAQIAKDCAAVVTLGAPGPAPIGLGSTGDSTFNVPASLLGAPAITLPVLSVDGLPLGFQTIGYAHEDAALFAIAAWLKPLLSATH
jgi:Asp-tRNA(Asn)/Glu-tRNA(Gln) amidotransferase A subunit family amidase